MNSGAPVRGAAEDGAPLLEGRGMGKRFGGLVALKDVDIAVHRGEVVGVIGPNGSGKTTLFDCLTRMVAPSAGRVLFHDVDITRKKPYEVARMGLSRTFQGIRVYRKLSALENMLLSRRWAGERLVDWLRPSDRPTMDRAHDLLAFLTLHEQRALPAGSLSWGQQRLLEIGMVLMSDPDVILLDEATSGVNPALVDVIKERILTLSRRDRKTVVLIEHDVEVVEDLCERVVVLDHGEKLAEGTPAAVFQDPAVIEAYFGRDDVDD